MNNCSIVSIIVTVTSDDRIYMLVDSLKRQNISTSYTIELIVVENGSLNYANLQNDPDLLIRHFATIETNTSLARNIGLNAARGHIILTTDADAVAHPDWIRGMVEALTSGPYAVVGGPVRKYAMDNWVQKHAITIVDGQSELNYLPASNLPYVVGVNAGFIASTLREAGGYDEELYSGADVDICYKIGILGYKVGLAPEAIVFHDDRTSVAAHFARFQRYAYYQVLLFVKYKEHSGRSFIINPYPFTRIGHAVKLFPKAIYSMLLNRDFGFMQQIILTATEALAIWIGDLKGSWKFRCLYI